MKNLKNLSECNGMNKRAQQEIVGFVLIVVLVVIAMMVFLIISVRNDSGETTSVRISNILDVLMKTTTECAISYEPDYDSFEELFKSCYKGSSCSNLDRSACDYLNESVNDVLSSMTKSDASIEGWEFSFFARDGDGILKLSSGNCTSYDSGAQRSMVSGGTTLVTQMRICEI